MSDYLSIIILFILIIFTIQYVNDIQPYPYMDEIFHYRQTLAYCQSRWSHWEPSLTTPPGSYILPLLTSYCLNIQSMRLINTIWFLIASIVISRLIRRNRSPCSNWSLLSILTNPIILFHSLLYYTDIPSLATCMATLLAFRSGKLEIGAVLGAISVIFRQTNIIWFMFACLEHIIIEYDEKSNNLFSFITQCLSQANHILRRYRSSILVAVSAVLIAAVNGSIVLGDKSNHIARLHLVQILYFSVFACICLLPISIRTLSITQCAIITPILVIVINATTYAHPFIQSDNRHYTFYIWKNFFSRYSLFRYILIPIYLTCFSTIRNYFHCSRRSLIWQCVYWICVGLCLIPSPLIDFRYFIVPYVIMSIEDQSRTRSHLYLNIICNITINIITLYIFLYRPFIWPDGSIARFMW